jgi:hypothetical protein
VKRRGRLFLAPAAMALAAMTMSGPARAERAGELFTCWTMDWHDFSSWYYGSAGICYYPDGGAQQYDHNGGYGTM